MTKSLIFLVTVVVVQAPACSTESGSLQDETTTIPLLTTTSGTSQAPPITVGANELSDQQVRMVGSAYEWYRALKAGDGDLAASYMAETGLVHYPTRGQTLGVSDCSLAEWINAHPTHYATLVTDCPPFVFNNTVVMTGTIDGILDALTVLEFSAGEGLEVTKATTSLPLAWPHIIARIRQCVRLEEDAWVRICG